jgi:hypothetical protein
MNVLFETLQADRFEVARQFRPKAARRHWLARVRCSCRRTSSGALLGFEDQRDANRQGLVARGQERSTAFLQWGRIGRAHQSLRAFLPSAIRT